MTAQKKRWPILPKKGYTVFVVTNQSGIARGYYTVDDMNKLHEFMAQQVAAAGGKIEKILLLSASAGRQNCGIRR